MISHDTPSPWWTDGDDEITRMKRESWCENTCSSLDDEEFIRSRPMNKLVQDIALLKTENASLRKEVQWFRQQAVDAHRECDVLRGFDL